ncbi:hypothetical protein CAEBREN_19096 [Caenorhabditis brenneri]|uniref:Uncharacterized protein n=1 Tax=Caenorhabditis brenneri TaxID=135651 RepID=G0MMF9_CAEBE|nr:hypothetical protein CAEBREN_19096 [Caenorhabditis brenneri]
MSYDSLKILLQYAKPNLRFELSRRIPSIRLTEKAVPLRIDKLWIGSLGVEVNNTFYEARTIRYFPPSGIVPRRFHDSHDGDWDLDEWGFDDFSSETIFTPGDLVLQVKGQNPRQKIQNEEYKKDLEKRLKYIEWIIAKKSGENVESEWTGAEEKVRETMIEIQALFEGTKTERSIRIPVNNFSQISVSYGDDEAVEWGIQLRLLKIEVVAA